MAKKAGADGGNNALKLWAQGHKPMMIPSVYSEYLGDSVDTLDANDIPVDKLEDHIDITITSKALTFSGVRYIVGNKVSEDRLEPLEMEKKSDKSKDEIPVIVTLAGLAITAMKENPESDRISVSYDLSVALPIAFINKENATKNEQRYMGTHTVTFHHPSGRNVEVEIKIEFCKCLPEGAAAVWGVVFDEDGNQIERLIEDEDGVRKNVSFLDTTNLSFDIGAGTTEIVVTEGLNFKPTLSKGLNYGTKETILKFIETWNKEFPRKGIDSLAEFNEILFDSEHPRHADVSVKFKAHQRQLAVKLSKEIMNKIDDMKDDPYVFIYGGGATVVKDELQQILKQRGRDKNLFFLKDPMYVNAKGLLVYTCSPRFEELKAMAQGVHNG
ncbi:peptide ABC transporter substrate-binding protein [Cytobacillus sp. FJAT-54145]|uniref:Peptide ABC transporter substrate-binding protein n=1 Tax=Cytobacillus spartinae TaxID=3299023 RepID=A0ABW6KM26_9BACI